MEEAFHVAAAVEDAVNYNRFAYNPVYHAIGFVVEFPILGHSQVNKLLGGVSSFRKIRQIGTDFFQGINDAICPLHRIVDSDVGMDVLDIPYGVPDE